MYNRVVVINNDGNSIILMSSDVDHVVDCVQMYVSSLDGLIGSHPDSENLLNNHPGVSSRRLSSFDKNQLMEIEMEMVNQYNCLKNNNINTNLYYNYRTMLTIVYLYLSSNMDRFRKMS